MLQTLKDLLGALAPATRTAPPPSAEHQLQLATAVLLVEVMRAEPDLGAPERDSVIEALRQQFSLTALESERLLDMAHVTSLAAGDLFTYTSTINDGCTMDEKIHMVEQLWRVAFADGTLGAHENHLMRRVADLLHIPHGANVHAKMRARQATPSD